ncbi:MAG: class I mannose-6-phosphate isomerase [Treponema sp.]|nr:class I mannose-6-phosphate isomerase [Treponema sp.]
MAREIIFVNPVLKETVWGGSRLAEFGYALPSSHVGEAWCVSAHPHGDCVVASGAYAGIHLSELWHNHRELFGNCEGEQFPLLTKIIDAEKDLSIQVHPDDAYAKVNENGSLGKTECWYILDAQPNAKIVIGHHAKNRAEVQSMIAQQRWSEFIREVPVHKGDFFFIAPGTVHAIKGGTLLLETQQSSDVTYRVYDYDRLGSDGKMRALHRAQSIDVITAPFVESAPPKHARKTVNAALHELAGCAYFSVWETVIAGSAEIVQDQQFMIVSVVDGSGTVDGVRVQKGSHFIVPFAYGTARVDGDMQLVISAV